MGLWLDGNKIRELDQSQRGVVVLAEAIHRADALDVGGVDGFDAHDLFEVDGEEFAIGLLKNKHALGSGVGKSDFA